MRTTASLTNSRLVVAALSAAYLLAIVDRMVLSLLIEPIKGDLHLTDTEIGLLAGLAFGFFYTVMGIPIGRLADRLHRPALIATGVFFWSLATMACGLTSSFVQLFAARFCVGVGEASVSPASYSLIADYVPRPKLGRALGTYMLGTVVGLGIAWIAGGQIMHWLGGLAAHDLPLVSRLAPWQMVFVIVGLPGLIVAPLVLAIREPRNSSPPPSFDRESAAAPGDAGLAAVWARLRAHRSVYLAHFIGMAAVNTYGLALVTWAPPMFAREFGWSVQKIGVVLGTGILLAGVAGALVSAHLVDGLGRKGVHDAAFRVLFVGALLMGPFGILGPLAATAWARVALFIVPVMGLFFSIVACAPTALQIATPRSMRASISAVYLFIVNLIGYVVGPLSIGFVSDRWMSPGHNLAPALAILAAVCLPVAALCFRSGLAPFGELARPSS